MRASIFAATLAMAGCGSADHAAFLAMDTATPTPEADAGGVAAGGAAPARTSTGGAAGVVRAGVASAGGAAGTNGGPLMVATGDACGDVSICPQGDACAQRTPDDTTTYCLRSCHGDAAQCDAGEVCVGVYGTHIVSDCAAERYGSLAPYYCARGEVTSGC